MKCFIECFAEERYIGRSSQTEAVSVCRCVTHAWDFQQGEPTTATSLCPIGRIEDATDEALAKIARALEGK